MAYFPKDSAYSDTEADREAVSKMSSTSEIKQYYDNKALEQGLVVRDEMSPEVLKEVPQVAQPQHVTVTVAGKTFTGTTQEEIDAQLAAHFRSRQTQPEPQPARNSNGTFAKTTLEPSRTAGLDAISNNLVEKALADAGVSVEALKEFTAERSAEKKVVTSWAAATEAFKNGPGADWPGGEELKTRLGYRLAELGLTDAPSVASLVTAWESIQAEDARDKALANATSSDEIKEILGTREREAERIRAGRSY
jgi:hypothetical protein